MESDRITTPSGRQNYDLSSLSKSDKERIRAADPNNGLCLITATMFSLNYCHCIPKYMMKDKKILDSLEWAWNMMRYTLNLNTHQNVFLAKSDFHGLFDKGKWLLLPEERILDEYLNTLVSLGAELKLSRKNFPKINEEKYLYEFVPLQAMKDERIDITRGIGDEAVIHRYPYSTLPRLECHVHPKFAIFDAGMKLNKLLHLDDPKSSETLENVLKGYPTLKKIQILYRVWMYKPPNNALNDKTYVDPDLELVFCPPEVKSDSDSDGSEYAQPRRTKTDAGRGDWCYLLPRTKADEQADRPRTRSVTAVKQAGNADGNDAQGGREGTLVKKRKVLAESFTHNQQLLSEATLTRFNEQFGEAAWTSDRIRLWSSSPKKRRVRVPSILVD